MQSEFIITALLFIFTFLFGFWLSRSGTPYNSMIFNFHKLVGLAMGLFLIATVYQVHEAAPFNTLEISAITATVLVFILLVAAGGVLSIQAAGILGSASPFLLGAFSKIHKVLPYLAVLSTAGTLHLLLLQVA